MRACRLLLALMIVPMVLARAQSSDSVTEPEVRTSATVSRGVKPDLATVTLQFSADGKSPADAASRVAARADSLRRALVAIGIPRDSVITERNRYWGRSRIEMLPQPPRYVPRVQPAPSEPRNDVYYDTLYRANDGVEVHIHDITKVGGAIDAALALRITSMTPVRFTVSAQRTEMVHDSLLIEATRRARTEASIIAAANGSQLGAVRLLTTQGDNSRYGIFDLAASGDFAGLGAQTTSVPTAVVEPRVQISVSVFGRWLLVSKP